MRRLGRYILTVGLLVLAPRAAFPGETRLLRYPDIPEDHPAVQPFDHPDGRVSAAVLANAFASSLPAGPQERTSSPAGTATLTKVERIDPVPEPQRSGLASITARDSRILVTCLASDLLEGREAGSRGYRLASDFAASLFSLWGIEPAGDEADGKARGYFQEVVMKEYTDLGCAIEWRAGSPDGVTVRSFKEHADLENYYLNRVPETVSGPVVFAGYGLREEAIGYDDFSADRQARLGNRYDLSWKNDQ